MQTRARRSSSQSSRQAVHLSFLPDGVLRALSHGKDLQYVVSREISPLKGVLWSADELALIRMQLHR